MYTWRYTPLKLTVVSQLFTSLFARTRTIRFFFFFFTWKSKISVIRERKLIYIAELSESSLVNSIRYFPASNHYHRSVNHTFVFVCDERIIRLYRESVGISRKKSVYLLSIDNLRPHFVLFTSWRKSAPITLYNLHDCCISHI